MALAQLWDYPPKPFLEQVLEHCSGAATLYMYLWEKRDTNCCVHIPKKELYTKFHPNKVTNDIRALNNEGLVSLFDSKPGHICAELVDWQEFEEFEDS